MQNPFQQIQALLKLAIILIFWSHGSDLCQADGITPPAGDNQPSKVQLLSGAIFQDRLFYRAGIEIDLAPGALTYWRMPGDAGVPPVFSFEGSQNLDKAHVFFPAPQRLEEAGETAFGYKDRVIFPLHVFPSEPSEPVKLHFKLDYAVCTKICLPETARFSVELNPGQTASHPVETELALAEKSLPKPLTRAQAAILARLDWAEAESLKTGQPSWRLTWRGALPSDLFIEGPEGWYFTTGKTSNPQVFLLTAVDHPMDGAPSTKPEITLTLLEKDQSFEFKTELERPSDPN